MPFKYKTVLIVGATSGIGLDLADKVIAHGSHVIAVGRRQANLDDFREKHGHEKASTATFDITDLEGIPAFVKSVTTAHPTLDCVIFNSGMQRGVDFTKPESIDLPAVQKELTTNYLSFVYLTTAFLPFLQAQRTKTSIVYTTSDLSLVPIPRVPNYCASKAALHHLILVIREQLKDTNVKIIELMPPLVQTELHDEKNQPDAKWMKGLGMPLAEFTADTWQGLVDEVDEIVVSHAGKRYYEAFEWKRQEAFQQMCQAMRDIAKKERSTY